MSRLRRQLLRCGLGGFFGLTSGDFRLQNAIFGAAVDLLFADAVEARGVATSFRHDFLFSCTGNALAGSAVGKSAVLIWTHQYGDPGHTRWVNCGAGIADAECETRRHSSRAPAL